VTYVTTSPLIVPLDGRITSQNQLYSGLTGSEVMYIVAPGTASAGNSYQITVANLAAYISSYPYLNTEILTAGATLVSPYVVQSADSRILFKKTIGSASYTTCPLAASMLYGQEVLFKDAKGDAVTNNITISFTSGELCDGLSQLTIAAPYGWVRITPTPGGGSWYQTG
jgi:hypothetical protein